MCDCDIFLSVGKRMEQGATEREEEVAEDEEMEDGFVGGGVV